MSKFFSCKIMWLISLETKVILFSFTVIEFTSGNIHANTNLTLITALVYSLYYTF